MKAIICSKGNASYVYVCAEATKPLLKDNDVLVKVAAAAVNAADCRVLKLGLIPKNRILGSAIAGTVEAAGKDVRCFTVGDSVCAETAECGFGGLAEYTAVPEKALVKIPQGIPFDAAAALPLSSVTALQALRKGGIRPGMKVLIVGAGGGVGTFAVQLAVHYGAEVTAVCGERNIPIIQSLGAGHVINYATTELAKSDRCFDLILAVNGNYPLRTYKRLLAPDGNCVVVGGALSQLIKAILFKRFLSLTSRKFSCLNSTPDTGDLEHILQLVIEGKIRPIIDRRYPLHEAGEALRYIGSGHVGGKVIIEICCEKTT